MSAFFKAGFNPPLSFKPGSVNDEYDMGWFQNRLFGNQPLRFFRLQALQNNPFPEPAGFGGRFQAFFY
jgi:hypothetical protein